jgi:hypothetical protein
MTVDSKQRRDKRATILRTRAEWECLEKSSAILYPVMYRHDHQAVVNLNCIGVQQRRVMTILSVHQVYSY